MTRQRALFVAVAAAVVLARCGAGPTTPIVPPPPPPPVNTPPVVRSVAVSRTQLEAGQELDATATVEDAETPADQLEYIWSASKGTFTGTGRSVRWRAPENEPVPADYRLTVTVVERYLGLNPQGQVATLEHRVTGTSQEIRVNDAIRELRGLAEQFLVDFANSSVSPAQVVRNFTNSCLGKADELSDITNNRKDYTIVGESHRITSITLNSNWMLCTAPTGPASCALVAADVDWRSILKETGAPEHVRGENLMSGVYEARQWWLCDSRFFGDKVLKRLFLR
jgi:hypothetical protein